MFAQSHARGQIHNSMPMCYRQSLEVLDCCIVAYLLSADGVVGQKEARRRLMGSVVSDAFRNYADYATTDSFRAGMLELMALARDNSCAIMCAETVWWRCHRRIIADHLLVAGVSVAHIMGINKVE